MIQIVFLLIFLIFLAFATYILSDRDIMSPSVLFLLGFIFSIIFAGMNIDNWEINLSIKTIFIVLLGCLSFVAGFLFFKMLHKNLFSGVKEGPREIYIQKWKILLVILIDIFALYLQYRDILRVSQYADDYWKQFGLLTAYKQAIMSGTSTSSLVTQLNKLVLCSGYIYTYVFINNMYATKKYKLQKNWMYIVPIFFYVISTFMKGNRIGVLGIIIMMVFLSYYFSHKRNGWDKHLSFKFVLKIIVVCVIGLIGFYYSKSLVGRTSTLSIFDYISQYVGGSINLLDLYVKDVTITSSNYPLSETFVGLYNSFYKLGILNESFSSGLEFRYSPSGVSLGNVYTCFRRYYNDLGYFGVFIFTFLMSYFMNWFYYKVRKTSVFERNGNFLIMLYSTLVFVLPLSAMEEQFYMTHLVLGYFGEVLILYLLYKFTFTRIEICSDSYKVGSKCCRGLNI